MKQLQLSTLFFAYLLLIDLTSQPHRIKIQDIQTMSKASADKAIKISHTSCLLVSCSVKNWAAINKFHIAKRSAFCLWQTYRRNTSLYKRMMQINTISSAWGSLAARSHRIQPHSSNWSLGLTLLSSGRPCLSLFSEGSVLSGCVESLSSELTLCLSVFAWGRHY